LTKEICDKKSTTQTKKAPLKNGAFLLKTEKSEA
jgi:hypothetical protein